MQGNRSFAVALLALVVAIGLLGANGYYWWKSQLDAAKTAQALANSAAGNSEFQELKTSDFVKEASPYRDDEEAVWIEEAPSVRFYPHRSEDLGSIEMADGGPLPPMGEVLAEPAPLPEPHSAAPLPLSNGENWLTALIDRELPNASRDEKRVWVDELKGLEPQMVRDILRMRRQTAGPVFPEPSLIEDGPSEWRAAVPRDQLVPPPLDDFSGHAPVGNSLSGSLLALEEARNVVLHNLTNLNTTGFKRSRVVLEPAVDEVPLDPESNYAAKTIGKGVTLRRTLLDVSQGPLKKTGQPLDLAIDGPGFFQVASDEGQLLYTRHGMLTVNSNGMIGVGPDEDFYHLEPAITIPNTAVGIVVSVDGTVTILEAGEKAVSQNIGSIQLARFASPENLKPVKGNLLAETRASGTAMVNAPQIDGAGEICQGMLEQANTDRDKELERYQTLQSQYAMLKNLVEVANFVTTPGPVANQPKHSEKRASLEITPADRDKLIAPLKQWQNQGSNLINVYLQSRQVKAIKRKLGLND